ncbi:MAG TPA: hypothetical protein PLW44_06135 [Chitinophagales bacterium]|nr:hypothetical protein [Chitinophagales bacterium]
MRRKKKAVSKLESSDIWVMVIYLLISAILFLLYNNLTSLSSKSKVVFFYGYGTQFFLYMFQYKAMRKPVVYALWCIVGLGHLGIYLWVKQTAYFIWEMTVFRNTIILLLLFQLLRWVSLRVQGMDLAAGKIGKTDSFDGRRINLFDLLLTFIYLGVCLGLLLTH